VTDVLGVARRRLKLLLFGAEPRVRPIWFGNARGLRLHIDPKNKSQRIFGLDEYEIAGEFRRCVRQSRSFIDVGASDGFYALVARHLNPDIQCVACEPQQELRELALAMCRDNFGATDFLEWIESPIGQAAPFRSLDEVASKLTSPISIKIDVDGAEMDVLESGKECISLPETQLIVETHSESLEHDAIRFLNSQGKRTRIVRNGLMRTLVPELRPIPHNRWLVAN
jgi:hypothetical protein